ncbi:MAG: DEAD/DEAH box helicase, partial [Ureaplasma sp.]|nr:DEAD/DEAH box helicase [Ureaplasma sp.]
LQNAQKLVNEHEKNIRFEPNKMQKEALESLNLLRENNQNKALIVSATGTGKTYLAVFDVKQFNPNRILFIAHRDNILRSAKESFEFEFENSKTYGFINGQEKEFNKDFIFASSSTLNKDENLFKFNKDHFDYIIVDEAHHSAANSIEKIIKYFEPKFLLGLTATPNRTDGKEIYSLYSNNIAYEINLKKALENNLLCRFNYFGINDKFLLNTTNAKELCNENRINYIIEKAKYYGCYNNKVQGLIFVSSKSEAKLLTEMFNDKGIRTKYILSETKDNDKITIINELRERKIDYIVSVDVLSEGVDMPFVNQIIMLRPTKSTIVFSQQLGRGLRKYHDEFNYKDYLVVLDFIGNYDDNFLIPIALSNTTKIDKDNIKKTLVDIKYEEFNCNIEFDRISEEKIINSIDRSTSKIKVMFN